MDRFFVRSRDRKNKPGEKGFPVTKLNIAVTGLGRNVGTTLVSSALAFFFEEKDYNVSFTECREPADAESLFYDSVSMDKRFANRNFADIYKCIDEGITMKNAVNLEGNINWTLVTPENRRAGIKLSSEKRGRLIQSARGDICIFDIEPRNEWNAYLLDMDMILVAVDPMPSKLIGSADRFRRLRKMEFDGTEIKWIVNRVNNGINKREVKKYLKSENVFWLENIASEKIYASEYSSAFFWENGEIRNIMDRLFTEILH